MHLIFLILKFFFAKNEKKMPLKLSFLLILLAVLNLTASLSSDQLCAIKSDNCRSRNEKKNVAKMKCEILSCHGKYGYKCGLNHCSLSKEVCQKYLIIKNEMKTMAVLRAKFINLNVYETKWFSYKILTTNIKECDMTADEWQPTDVCLTGQNCRTKHKLPFRYSYYEYFNKAKCQCTGEYYYECDVNFCAKNQLACLRMQKTNGTKPCGNDNMIFEIA